MREETRRKKNIYNKLSIHQLRRSPVKAPFLGRHNHQQTLASLYHNITFKREIHSFLTSAIRWLPVGQRGRERPPKFTWSSFQNFTLDRQTSGHCWLFSRQLKKDSALINIHTCRETFRLLLLLEVLRPNFFREGGGGAEDSDAIVCYANRPHGVAPN